MTRPRFLPRTGTEREARAFHLGLETYRYDEERHLPWASYIEDSYRVWCIHLGFWRIEWTA